MSQYLRLPASFPLLCSLMAATTVSGCATLPWQNGPSEAEGVVEEARVEGPRVPYDVTIGGIGGDLLGRLREISGLVRDGEKPPATLGGLRQRAENDRQRLTRALFAEGYFGASVTFDIDTTQQPVMVAVDIQPGSQFKLASYDIVYDSPPSTAAAPRQPSDVGLVIGQPAISNDIKAAEQAILTRLTRNGHPFATVTDRKAIANLEEKGLRVELHVEPGPAAVFGQVEFDGLGRTDPRYPRRLVPWKRGDTFDQALIPRYDDILESSGIFESVTVNAASEVNETGEIPVTVRFAERKPRVITLGLRYSTTEGPGVRASWAHRNLFRHGENLTITGDVTQISQLASADLRIPHFTDRKTTGFVTTTFLTEQAEAYKERSWVTGVGLERGFLPWLRGSVGAQLDIGKITDLAGDELEVRQSQILSFPVIAYVDTTNDLLEPTRGIRLTGQVEPHGGVLEGAPLNYLFNEATASAYLPLVKPDRLVFAARGRFGTINGEALESIPADERFYSGGGGSVRGYGYQEAGALDDDGDPIGGLSVVEVGAELRSYIVGDFGAAIFFEGGTTYEDPVPDASEPLRWATGVGIRYRTPIGPIRADVGIPLNRRDTDDAFQFYLSIGQAF